MSELPEDETDISYPGGNRMSVSVIKPAYIYNFMINLMVLRD
jgi:hypothetical protein